MNLLEALRLARTYVDACKPMKTDPQEIKDKFSEMNKKLNLLEEYLRVLSDN